MDTYKFSEHKIIDTLPPKNWYIVSCFNSCTARNWKEEDNFSFYCDSFFFLVQVYPAFIVPEARLSEAWAKRSFCRIPLLRVYVTSESFCGVPEYKVLNWWNLWKTPKIVIKALNWFDVFEWNCAIHPHWQIKIAVLVM